MANAGGDDLVAVMLGNGLHGGMGDGRLRDIIASRNLLERMIRRRGEKEDILGVIWMFPDEFGFNCVHDVVFVVEDANSFRSVLDLHRAIRDEPVGELFKSVW